MSRSDGLDRQAAPALVPDIYVRVAVDRGVPDGERLEAYACVLEYVGVDGEDYVEGMRGGLRRR